MKEWLMSIIGIVCLGLFSDIILSESTINSFVKKIIAIISIFIIISPIKNITKIDFSKFFEYNYIEDSSYIENVYTQQKHYYEKYLEETLSKKGYNNVNVEIIYNLSNNKKKKKKVVLNLKNLVINENTMHINKYKEIKSIVCETLNIKEDIVTLNE